MKRSLDPALVEFVKALARATAAQDIARARAGRGGQADSRDLTAQRPAD